jgi:hypothetical protein
MSINPLENYVSSSIINTYQNILHVGQDGIIYGGSGSMINISVENLPVTGISASYLHGFDSKLNTSSFNSFTSSYYSDSASFSSSLTNKVDKDSNAHLTGVLFNTSSVATAGVGQLTWNDVDGTLDIGLKGGNVTLQLGQEQLIRVVNKTGANLLESQYRAVRIVGATGQRPSVNLALANSDITSETTIGLVTENIDNNQEGFITIEGLVRDINTTGALQSETWNDGDVLYLSPISSGQLTNVLPVSPYHRIVCGYVVYAHSQHGKIYVKIDNGMHLTSLHDVNIVSASNGQALTYDSSSGVWKNTNISVDTGSLVTTSSFNSFTSSYQVDSASFSSSLNTKMSNTLGVSEIRTLTFDEYNAISSPDPTILYLIIS